MIKNIIKNLKPSATLRINEETKKLESQGKKILSLVLVSLHFKYQKILLMNSKIMLIKISIYQCKDYLN